LLQLKAWLVIAFYELLTFTWRVKVDFDPITRSLLDARTPTVLAHWHGDEYSLIHLVRSLRLATMTSTSADGQVVDQLIRHLGGTTSRGSSTRGAVGGLKGLVRLLKTEGRITSIAVDGPRGPRHVVKPGVFELSRLAQAQVVPVGVYARSALRFENAWNKAYLPWPFAKIQIVFAAPFLRSEASSSIDPRDPTLGLALAEKIDDASSQARALF
jgi:lysophospholipid acyltransferase (LPLAT)-like uncharacterized protein